MSDDPVSLRVLREQGPLTLRELTSATASKLAARLEYEDVEAVMEQARKLGRAARYDKGDDFREHVWEYVK